MFLSRIHLDPRCKAARRDLADPYQLHATLCRAFCGPERKRPASTFLWRLEPETGPSGRPRLLVQSRAVPDWTAIGVPGWLAEADPSVNLRERLGLDALRTGQRFRFRLRANPCVTRNGKRQGLLGAVEQEQWLVRQGTRHGFSLLRLGAFDFSEASPERIDVRISQERMLRGRQHNGNRVRVFSVLYDGVLAVEEADRFREALQTGIGHGKVMGLGLLSVAPVT
ncbi:MAG: type I-E CRISPR-associated protein Cas6/Cse3/CasE [Leptospirillia bacterium]